MNADHQELDAGDFEPVTSGAGGVETESQSGKGSKGAKQGGNGEPQTIKTSPHTWNRRKIIDWRAVEQAAIAGVSYPVLAKEYGTTPESIKVKAHQGQWPTPERVRKEAEKRIKEEQARLHRAKLVRANGGPLSEEQERSLLNPSLRESGPGWGDDSDGEGWKEQDAQEAGSDSGGAGSARSGEGEASTALTGVSRGRSVSVVVSENLADMAESGTLHAARRALRSIKSAPDSLPIRGASDLAILAKLLRSMAGLDSPQVSVNLGLFTQVPPDSASLGVVLDAEDVGE